MTQDIIRLETYNLGRHGSAVESALDMLMEQRTIDRIWAKDWTVWKPEPREIADRLGWLTAPWDAENEAPEFTAFAEKVRHAGFRHALLLGMGGSSLAPEVLGTTFKTKRGFLDLRILDSTDPAAVLRAKASLPLEKTLFIVSSKSGTTVETLSFLNYFFNEILESAGKRSAGSHFAAITDPGTPLEDTASRHRFRAIFQGKPEIGGRFSALSAFGLVPAVLKGIDIRELLRSAGQAAELCRISDDPCRNPGARLGTVLAVLAMNGLDKATFISSPRLRSFGVWLEQLIAESTGKDGRGILPVLETEAGLSGSYGPDRIFVSLELEGDETGKPAGQGLQESGYPLISIKIKNINELGSQFFLWEFATAVAGYHLGINPFDQPDVDAAKKKAQEFLKIYRESGSLPPDKPKLMEKGIGIFSDLTALSLKDFLKVFLRQAQPGDYVSIQAFLDPGLETAFILEQLADRLRSRTRLAVTWGLGPRFLHSTGQLHKGDAGKGLFIQITADDSEDIPIPDGPGSKHAGLTFGVLKAAQARGDLEALKSLGRRVLRLHLGKDALRGFNEIAALI